MGTRVWRQCVQACEGKRYLFKSNPTVSKCTLWCSSEVLFVGTVIPRISVLHVPLWDLRLTLAGQACIDSIASSCAVLHCSYKPNSPSIPNRFHNIQLIYPLSKTQNGSCPISKRHRLVTVRRNTEAKQLLAGCIYLATAIASHIAKAKRRPWTSVDNGDCCDARKDTQWIERKARKLAVLIWPGLSQIWNGRRTWETSIDRGNDEDCGCSRMPIASCGATGGTDSEMNSWPVSRDRRE